MNKTVKRILIVIGAVVVLLALVMGGFMLKMKSEMKQMKVIETGEVVHNVYTIRDSFVNMFLIKDSDKFVAIDAGNDAAVILEGLKKLSIDPGKVTAVFLTHSDGDHVGALKLFPTARVYLSMDEEQMINGTKTKLLFFHNKLDRKEYTLLNDHQIVQVGNVTIHAIMTPGHTTGSMSYLVNDSCLFVGDAFGLKNGKLDRPNKFFSADMKTAIQSFHKINELPHAKYIFTAHTGFSNDYKSAVNTRLE
ncbi:MAG: MBL fold metallo-hydrolase [Paludibacter sp.]|nr:MBL fold metallo-hydrolase [Paludibacter sp.]